MIKLFWNTHNQKKINGIEGRDFIWGKYHRENSEYLYIRGKLFYKSELYYPAIDTLLVALEFGENNKIYELLSEIYNIIGNKELSSKILDTNLKLTTVNMLKNELSGIYRK